MRLIIHRDQHSFGASLCINEQEAEEHREFLKEGGERHPILTDENIVLNPQQAAAVAALDAIDNAIADGGKDYRHLLETFVRIGFEAGVMAAKTL